MRLFVVTLSILLLGVFRGGIVCAQSEHLFYYSYKDGLPFLRVYSCVQDKDGFLWLGTDNGLCRFDGTNFETFTNHDGLPDNEILEVVADDKGGIWGRTTSRQLFYFKDRKCITIFEKNTRHIQFYDIFSDKEGINIYSFQDKFSQKVVFKLEYGKVQEVFTGISNSGVSNICWVNKDTLAIFYGFNIQYLNKQYKPIKTQNLNDLQFPQTYLTSFFDFDSISFMNLRQTNGHDTLYWVINDNNNPPCPHTQNK